jgi:hypothetical protein
MVVMKLLRPSSSAAIAEVMLQVSIFDFSFKAVFAIIHGRVAAWDDGVLVVIVERANSAAASTQVMANSSFVTLVLLCSSSVWRLRGLGLHIVRHRDVRSL